MKVQKHPCDGEMRFQSEKGIEVVFHFHVEQMKLYLQRQCYLFFRCENRQISNEDLENMGQNLLNDLTSTLHRNNPAIGREILFWVQSKRCVIRKPIDINNLLNFVSFMGFKDLKDLIIANDLHSMRPEASLLVVCTFCSTLLGYKVPNKFRLRLHLYEDEYFYVDEVTRPTVKHPPSLLKFFDVGTLYEDDERTSPFMSTTYAENRGSVFTIRGPRGVKSFKTFIHYITDITHYGHQPFEVPPLVFPMVKRSEDPEDDSESKFDEDLREVI